MAETLSVTDLLPNKFEPKRGYRWVLAIEGILSAPKTRSTIKKTKTISAPLINHIRTKFIQR